MSVRVVRLLLREVLPGRGDLHVEPQVIAACRVELVTGVPADQARVVGIEQDREGSRRRIIDVSFRGPPLSDNRGSSFAGWALPPSGTTRGWKRDGTRAGGFGLAQRLAIKLCMVAISAA